MRISSEWWSWNDIFVRRMYVLESQFNKHSAQIGIIQILAQFWPHQRRRKKSIEIARRLLLDWGASKMNIKHLCDVSKIVSKHTSMAIFVYIRHLPMSFSFRFSHSQRQDQKSPSIARIRTANCHHRRTAVKRAMPAESVRSQSNRFAIWKSMPNKC